MPSVAQFIEAHREPILQGWRAVAQTSSSARGLSVPELFNLMPTYLSLIGQSSAPLHLSEEQQRLIKSHLSHRLRQGYELNEVLFEFSLLGRTISRLIDAEPPQERPPTSEVADLFSELLLTSHTAARIFTEHLLEDEQREKRYSRLVAQIAAQALARNGRTPPLGQRLREVLALIMEAMVAQTASLLLVEPGDSETLIAVASAGLADEALARYTASIDADSFPSRIAASKGEPLELPDVTTAAVPVSATLKKSGIHSLLGVRLPAQHLLRGVLYVGLTEPRNFTASELRRLASLGERLTLHLDNAELVSELRSKVSAVQMFVDVLAHDLRGPLCAARLAAEMLENAVPDSARQRLTRLERSLERADRMVTDLLDAHRVDAGERLHLTMSNFDLVAVAKDVADELNQQFPGRVIVRAPGELRGRWSSPYVRRAIWNLTMNGLKYGAQDQPVLVEIVPRADEVELAVHNAGAPIPAEQQRRLFELFSRGPDRSGAGQGWGLGLALVRGAAEAHGGSVEVISDAARGTTFTIRLPRSTAPAGELNTPAQP